jgi:hypothetical protein
MKCSLLATDIANSSVGRHPDVSNHAATTAAPYVKGAAYT